MVSIRFAQTDIQTLAVLVLMVMLVSDFFISLLDMQSLRDPQARVFFSTLILLDSLHWSSWHDHSCDVCCVGKFALCM